MNHTSLKESTNKQKRDSEKSWLVQKTLNNADITIITHLDNVHSNLHCFVCTFVM